MNSANGTVSQNTLPGVVRISCVVEPISVNITKPYLFLDLILQITKPLSMQVRFKLRKEPKLHSDGVMSLIFPISYHDRCAISDISNIKQPIKSIRLQRNVDMSLL